MITHYSLVELVPEHKAVFGLALETEQGLAVVAIRNIKVEPEHDEFGNNAFFEIEVVSCPPGLTAAEVQATSNFRDILCNAVRDTMKKSTEAHEAAANEWRAMRKGDDVNKSDD